MSSAGGSYTGSCSTLLAAAGARIGDTISVEAVNGDMTGVLMPRYESAHGNFIVIKLKSGYNIGIDAAKIRSIRRVGVLDAPKAGMVAEERPNQDQDLPRIALISTGGTIASKIDYRTGGVHAALTAKELQDSVPELGTVALIDPSILFSEYSENLAPSHWSRIAEEVAKKVSEKKYAGIVVSHGTDTMHYTAAALSFALSNLPIPVVLVGSQRSSDRPSSDAALNLLGAATFASKSQAAGVFVAMHASTSDDSVVCHVGTRVRKNHTSRRDAFESIDVAPAAVIKGSQIEFSADWKDLLLPSA
ncbi:MAG TPA: Glu-tRNA(Gln) amidotransferase subunit GatD, partial [Nitrososphaera sp.]|nr:Glu-tRNA(Gln) amidotransferase subunit GatD [Nitrososphaera sp.]